MEKTIEELLLHRENPLGQGLSVVFPDYAGYCISKVPALIGSILGASNGSAPITKLGDPFRSYSRIVFLVLDGLGYRKAQALFREYPDSALRGLGEAGCQVPLTSVYPSTTVAALSSLSTGLTPLEHGMIGYRLYLRETASITNMIRFTTIGNSRPDSAFAIGLDRETLIPHPTVHERLQAQGISVHSVLPGYIANSGLSTAHYRGCTEVHSAVSLPDMFVRTREILQKSGDKTFISLYWPGLDSVAHVMGPDSESYRDEFCAVDAAIRRGLVGQVEDTLFIATSDHGFVSMRPEDYLLLNGEFDADRALLMPPVGEPRASYLYARDGKKKLIRNAFASPRDDGLICIDSQELVDSGLIGINTPHPEIANRIGDLALLSTGTAGTFQEYPDAALLRGMHGGLTEEEMLVPLIMAPL
ncbi:MAG: alkaline phosphatase family protein [Candidatus Atribacteria bacterium]|nr:MAG: alkaline phosphatase family protein [Candidatus Atribacteria bacterium]